MEIPLGNEDAEFLHRLLSSVVVPRPIGWISSRDADGRVNLAPFSYFSVASTVPPVLTLSFEPRDDGSTKDTPSNVEATGEFVYNLVTEPLLEAVDRTSAPLDASENEFDIAAVTQAPAETVDVPRVAEAEAHFECILENSLDVYGNTVVFGRVEHVHLSDSLLDGGEVDATLVDAVGRIGGPYYTGIDILPTQRDYDPDL